jgi:fructose/tagatose bisphosphate aldolase
VVILISSQLLLEPRLAHLGAIAARVIASLVLHGASGVSAPQRRAAVAPGIAKVNVMPHWSSPGWPDRVGLSGSSW